MSKFRNTLEECHLGDLGYRGSKFTWSNKQYAASFVKERLDRAVATPAWCAHYHNSVIEVLLASTSNHRPLYLQFDKGRHFIPKVFHFEAKWNLDEECSMVVTKAWVEERDGGRSLGHSWNKLDCCKVRLTEWSKAKFGNAKRIFDNLSKKLGRLQNDENPKNLEAIKHVQGDLNKLLEMEEVSWRRLVGGNGQNGIGFLEGIGIPNSFMLELTNAEDLILLDPSRIWLALVGPILKILGRPSKAISKSYFQLKVWKGLRNVLK